MVDSVVRRTFLCPSFPLSRLASAYSTPASTNPVRHWLLASHFWRSGKAEGRTKMNQDSLCLVVTVEDDLATPNSRSN